MRRAGHIRKLQLRVSRSLAKQLSEILSSISHEFLERSLHCTRRKSFKRLGSFIQPHATRM